MSIPAWLMRGGFWIWVLLEVLTNLLHVDRIKQDPTAHQIILGAVAVLGAVLARSERVGGEKSDKDKGEETVSRAALLPIALALGLGIAACGRVVRDGAVYNQELRFWEVAGPRVADRLLGVAAARATAGDAAGCAELADEALVVKIRAPWHAAKARYLVGKGDDPGQPPKVPTAAAWCAEAAK